VIVQRGKLDSIKKHWNDFSKSSKYFLENKYALKILKNDWMLEKIAWV
jgi:hypothetical protein